MLFVQTPKGLPLGVCTYVGVGKEVLGYAKFMALPDFPW